MAKKKMHYWRNTIGGVSLVIDEPILHKGQKSIAARKILHFMFGSAKFLNGVQWRHAV